MTQGAWPGKTFSGHIDSLSPATGATFALLPPDNATGNFTKVVQRVPVKIAFDHPPPLDNGLSATVTVDTRGKSRQACRTASAQLTIATGNVTRAIRRVPVKNPPSQNHGLSVTMARR